MERHLKAAVDEINACFIPYEQAYKKYKMERPGTGACVNMGIKIREVKEALCYQNVHLLSNQEKLKRISQCLGYLQVETCAGGQRKIEEKWQQQ